MKALKITIALIAILLLTVSGVQSGEVNNEQMIEKKSDNIDLLAHGRAKLKLPSRG